AAIQLTRTIIGDQPTYVTIDIDGIDPAFAPGTGTPVIGGLTSYETQRIIRGLEGSTIIGGDVVEVSPPYDTGSMTSLLGATLMYEVLCLVALTRARSRDAIAVTAGTVS
ncbi:MAG: arginase family protein, partial [Nitratireductor sp.]